MTNSESHENTACGHQSLNTHNVDGTGANTGLGYYAGGHISSGVHNTVIGHAAGSHTVNIQTGSYNTILGSNSNTSATDSTKQIAIGYNVSCIANSTITVGDGTNTASLGIDGSDTSWAATSDIRLKDNVEDSLAGLDFINELRPITYKWKAKKDVPQDMFEYGDGSDEPCKGTGKTNHGFVAQEVKAVIDKYDSVKDGNNIWNKADSGTQSVAPSALVPMLVKSVQELSAKVEELEAKLK